MAATRSDGGGRAAPIPKGYVPVPRGTAKSVTRTVRGETGGKNVVATFAPRKSFKPTGKRRPAGRGK